MFGSYVLGYIVNFGNYIPHYILGTVIRTLVSEVKIKSCLKVCGICFCAKIVKAKSSSSSHLFHLLGHQSTSQYPVPGPHQSVGEKMVSLESSAQVPTPA